MISLSDLLNLSVPLETRINVVSLYSWQCWYGSLLEFYRNFQGATIEEVSGVLYIDGLPYVLRMVDADLMPDVVDGIALLPRASVSPLSVGTVYRIEGVHLFVLGERVVSEPLDAPGGEPTLSSTVESLIRTADETSVVVSEGSTSESVSELESKSSFATAFLPTGISVSPIEFCFGVTLLVLGFFTAVFLFAGIGFQGVEFTMSGLFGIGLSAFLSVFDLILGFLLLLGVSIKSLNRLVSSMFVLRIVPLVVLLGYVFLGFRSGLPTVRTVSASVFTLSLVLWLAYEAQAICLPDTVRDLNGRGFALDASGQSVDVMATLRGYLLPLFVFSLVLLAGIVALII